MLRVHQTVVAGWNQNFLWQTSSTKVTETLALHLGSGARVLHCPTLPLAHYLKQILHQMRGFTPALDSAVMKHLSVIPLSTWSLQKPSARRENLLEELLIIKCCTITFPA